MRNSTKSTTLNTCMLNLAILKFVTLNKMLIQDCKAASWSKHHEFQTISHQIVHRSELLYIQWNLHDVLANED